MESDDYFIKAKLIIDARGASAPLSKVEKEVKKLARELEKADVRAVKSKERAAVKASRVQKRANAKALAEHHEHQKRMHDAVGRVQERLMGGGGGAGLTRQLLAIGAAYVGFQALSGITKSLIGDTIKYSEELEKTKVSLTAVLQAVGGGSWDAAAVKGEGIFQQLQTEAVTSVATSQELLGVFQSIVGPIQQAGFGMDYIVKLTSSAVTASTALGVDLAQAQRDIGMMVRGTAGMDVKLFSMLRSTGAIAETTEEWNKNLTAAARVEKLQAALGKFQEAGTAYGKTWAGLKSTFTDLVQLIGGAAFAPIFRVMKLGLGQINDALMRGRGVMERRLENFGVKVANALQSVIDVSMKAFAYIDTHWDEIVSKIGAAVDKAKMLAPILLKAAMVYEAANLARPALAAGFGVVGQLVGGAAGAAGAGGAAGAAGAAGGAGAVAASGEAVGMTAFTESMALLAPVIAYAAVALAALVSVGLAAQAQWRHLTGALGEDMAELSTAVYDMGRAWGGYLLSSLKIVGSVILVVLVPVLQIAVNVLTLVAQALGALASAGAYLASTIYEYVEPATSYLIEVFRMVGNVMHEVAESIKTVFNHISGLLGGVGAARLNPYDQAGYQQSDPEHDAGQSATASMATSAMANNTGYVPPKVRGGGGGTTNNNDFRGSHIKIEQKFEGEHDPDRVVFAMMDQLTRQAENRISSAYSGALTR